MERNVIADDIARRAAERADMVERQIVRRGITEAHIVTAMQEVPRDLFVPPEQRPLAYRDGPLPIDQLQTISQPYIVALMIAIAEVAPAHRVLEVGTGSGYGAAILSRIADQVFTVERHGTLARQAQALLSRLGYDNVAVRTGDGRAGWREQAPFDAILVTAAAPFIPRPLRDQLAIGGRLVMPVGSADRQRLVRLTRMAEQDFDEENLEEVRFVPLVGAEPNL